MKTVGLCTHFTETDKWAFDYAFELVQKRHLQLNICHWLESPYQVRRDLVYDDLFSHQKLVSATPELLNKLELKLRQHYEPKLGNFTDVAFKLCEGSYQVELMRCFRQNLLDMVVMGYQKLAPDASSGEQPMESFIVGLPFPIVVVGPEVPNSFLINEKASEIVELLALPEGSWRVLQPA
jgi:hypothetical protein